MPSLKDIPPIAQADPGPIYRFVPERHRQLVRDVWETDGVPFASMKLENDLTRAVGITFTMSSFRYDRRRRTEAIRSVFARAGFAGRAEEMLRLSRRIGDILGLLCLPTEVVGFDVGADEVRQIKTYIRTNISNERLVDRYIECEPASRETERACVAAAMDAFAPERKASVLAILERLQHTDGALEGVAIDLEPSGAADVKMYFLPRFTGGVDDVFEAYSDVQTLAFIETALSMFGLERHRAGAERMVREMAATGLRCSFLAVEEKADGSHELKVDFNTSTTGTTFENRRVSGQVASDAIRSAFRAVSLEVDEAALADLTRMIGPAAILLDNFTTDFSLSRSSGKVYLRSSADLGSGVRPSLP